MPSLQKCKDTAVICVQNKWAVWCMVTTYKGLGLGAWFQWILEQLQWSLEQHLSDCQSRKHAFYCTLALCFHPVVWACVSFSQLISIWNKNSLSLLPCVRMRHSRYPAELLLLESPHCECAHCRVSHSTLYTLTVLSEKFHNTHCTLCKVHTAHCTMVQNHLRNYNQVFLVECIHSL